MKIVEPMDKKFKDCVHYICAHGRASLGAIKLNKILWFLDASAYIETGRSVTGSKYVRRKNGPVPKRILRALEELEAEGKIAIGESQVGPYKKKDFVSLTDPDTSRITKEEMEMMNFLICDICDNHTANSISDATHDIIWEAAMEGEEIPLEATLASLVGEITEAHIAWADEAIQLKAA